LTERAELPPLRLRKEAFDRVGTFLQSGVERALRAGAARWDGTIQDTWWHDYAQRLELFQATGQLPEPDYKVIEVTRNNRTVSNNRRSGVFDDNTFAALTEDFDSCQVEYSAGYGVAGTLTIWSMATSTIVVLEEPMNSFETPITLDQIEAILLEYPLAAPPELEQEATPSFRVFVGHGNDHQWRILSDELRSQHGYDIEAFEGRPRAGLTIRDVLNDMAQHSAVALLIMTAADEMSNGGVRARQNVVHEVGYFQGRLGWENAIVVAEEGIEMPSNLDGTQQVRFPPGDIGRSVGQVVATLRHRQAELARSHSGL
jgi:hypothetical protein